MLIQIPIHTDRQFSFSDLQSMLGMDDLVLAISPDEMSGTWAFYRRNHSVTMFLLQTRADGYLLSMDRLASYDDYRFLPYLVDTLCLNLTDEAYQTDGQSAFQFFDEDWIAEEMGEEIAYLKCLLSIGHKYYLSLPIKEANLHVSERVLNSVGVSIFSSTPRIFGYINYLLRHDLLPADHEVEVCNIDDEVDVPQHKSIGTVLSWQTDGTETTESYAQQDVDLLLRIASEYSQDQLVEGVVLNDIATIFEYGIGVEQDPEKAIYWYKEAIKHGDLLYAPTSLGDIYRRGLPPVQSDLHQALEAYRQSVDPYSWYRIGQSYEEGWTSPPDLDKAMQYYRKAAAVGHHLALNRLSSDDES